MALVISRANQTSGTEVEDDAVLIGANRVKGGSGPFAEVYSEDLELEFERMVKLARLGASIILAAQFACLIWDI